MGTSQNWPNELHSICGSEKIAWPRFQAVSLRLQAITAELSKIKKRAQCALYFTFNALLNYFKVLV